MNHVKEYCVTTPSCCIPIFLKNRRVRHCSWSNHQCGNLGRDRTVAYASRTLNQSEKAQSTIEKETLGIVWACQYFRPYYFGRRFIVYTEHRPLVWLFNIKEPNSELVRWRLKLSEYDYKIVFKPGENNIDAPSRIQLNIHETESVINNPGETTLEYLRQYASNPDKFRNPEPPSLKQ